MSEAARGPAQRPPTPRLRIAFAGGGTGGHLFPGLAVAEAALAHGFADSVVFFGAQRGVEARLVPTAGYELIAEPLTGIRGGGVAAAVSAVARLLVAVARTAAVLRKRRVDVLVGLGGYASSAGVIAARLVGVPVVLMEQNRDPGLSNRVLSRFAAAVCTSFAATAAALPSRRARLTGNPVRPALERAPPCGSRDALLVFGGSGGAVSLNRAVTTALGRLVGRLQLPRVVHQTGAKDLAEVRSGYERMSAEPAAPAIETHAFIDDMAGAYGSALLAVCRSGATSVAELIATGTPAILIPYPHAAGDHQTANAQALVDAGAALLIHDDGATADRLTEALQRLLQDREAIHSMAASAAALRNPGAAERVLGVIRAVTETRK